MAGSRDAKHPARTWTVRHTTKSSPAQEGHWGMSHLLLLPPGSLESHRPQQSPAEWMGTKQPASIAACGQ